MDIICLVPLKHTVKYITRTSGYSTEVDTHNRVPVLSTQADMAVVKLNEPGAVLTDLIASSSCFSGVVATIFLLYNSHTHISHCQTASTRITHSRYKKGKAGPYSITKSRFPELIPVLGSQPAGDVNHKPDGRLSLLSVRPAVTLTTLTRAATNFAAW